MLRAVESFQQLLEKEVVMVFALLHLHQVCYGTVRTSFRVENVELLSLNDKDLLAEYVLYISKRQ